MEGSIEKGPGPLLDGRQEAPGRRAGARGAEAQPSSRRVTGGPPAAAGGAGRQLWVSGPLGLTLCPAFCGFPFPMVSMTNCKPLFSLKINTLMGLGEAL